MTKTLSRTVRHKKRGSIYNTLFTKGVLQTKEPLQDGDIVMTYVGLDGQVWHRPPHEFEDGRFEELSPGIPDGCDNLTGVVLAALTAARHFTDDEGGRKLALRRIARAIAAVQNLGRAQTLLRAFVDKHEITCPETIYQSDSVVENACQLIESLVGIVGYKVHEDDE